MKRVQNGTGTLEMMEVVTQYAGSELQRTQQGKNVKKCLVITLI